VVQAMQTLTGSHFDFRPRTISTPAARRPSLERFARWISKTAQQNTSPECRLGILRLPSM